ncbi:MAG: GNAT family N-acetyltransferase [Flammeovirgaceae bacterium]|nr:GNAT family N-acetyltransferase [Flammeovirgaceae bacterium]MBR08428.1 GNAT family N-acetyltransferase [Rickettsiales bacterium]HCX24499.1 GNAT family N-acetyltransferase [Cytophagales bacterium]|tara:strand:+ start:843 stop:1301 length:459 start_codon:yes stop_codon:yes gene_type:complete
MKLEIRKLGHSEKPPMDLLLKADPSEAMIEKYLYAGECYIAEAEDNIIGVFVLLPNSVHEIELMNISVLDKYQHQGVGKDIIKFVARIAKLEGYEDLIVKTADVSKDAQEFYKKMKFEYDFTVKGYFIQYYEEPIMENGQQAIDQIVLRKKL